MITIPPARRHYRSIITDSNRWNEFTFRPGDIVISTPPKSGTTWMQMLCALLIFNGPDLPAPLEDVSPWLDKVNRPMAEVSAVLDAQSHRRFIKTHTPLDGLPLHAQVTYVVVGRDPRDVSISREHHHANMDFSQFLELRASAVGNAHLAKLPATHFPKGDSAAWLRTFIENETNGGLPTLATTLHHLDTAWRRQSEANIALFHFADMQADLTHELLRLARILGVPLSMARARELAPEASLTSMRERANELAPNTSRGNLKDVRAFFRNGAIGEWIAHLTADDRVAYERRVATLVTSDLASWAHGGWLASGIAPAP